VANSIEVKGAAPLINTDDPEVGATVENIQISELPIVNRNAYTLLNIVPGVQQNSNQVGLGLPEQHTSINGSVEAGYSGSVNYYLDGGANVGSLRNSGNTVPNPDVIEEFCILADNYSAEYGRFAGGVISVVTKSGTNNLHGTLVEFLRNNDLNANNWGPRFRWHLCTATSSDSPWVGRFARTRPSSSVPTQGCGRSHTRSLIRPCCRRR